MSGTGKSSVLDRLYALGYQTIDMDDSGWSNFDATSAQFWEEEKLLSQLESSDNTPLFIDGCSESQLKFYDYFTDIILLSAPFEVMELRLRIRTNNSYGKTHEEMQEIKDNLALVEPLLRRHATLEIVTTLPIEQVVEEILRWVL